MKLLFAHDHRFVRAKDGKVYSAGQFPYQIWQRYLDAFDEIIVVGREAHLPPGTNLERLNVSSGPRVSFLTVPSVLTPLAFLSARPAAAKKINAAVQECDALVARVGGIGFLAANIAERLNKPWAVEVVACVWDSMWNYGNWQGKLYAPYAMYEAKSVVKRAPYAIYVTKEFLQKRYPCYGQTAYCSNVQIPEFGEEILAQRLRKIEHHRPKTTIGLIGTLTHAYKGIETALRALRIVRNSRSDFEFRILGSGDPGQWRRLAEELHIQENVIFCGTLPSGEAVYNWLDEIDIYIQPSYQEGLPRALIEAMSRGCPALGSTAGGIPELLDHGCIHRPGDEKRLASLLTEAMTDINWQKRQARRNFAEARQYTSLVLDTVRRRFWLKFAEYAKGKGLA